MTASVAVFVLAGSLVLLWVFAGAAEREERAAFEALARADCAFLDQTGLPRSAQMAAQLGAVTGVRVFFKSASQERLVGDGRSPPPPMLEAAGEDGRAQVQGRSWVIARSLRDGSSVYFVREAPERLAALERRETWLALIVFWVLSLGLGAWLARRVAVPIQALARALPDVGEDRALPAIPIEREDEIGQLARCLSATHDALLDEREQRRAGERLALLGRMAASLAHEVRNPVAAIKLHAQLVDGASASDAAASLHLIEAEADRIESLVRQWMLFAKPAPPRRSELDLSELVRELVLEKAAMARHAAVELHLTGDDAPKTIQADAERVRQALVNVLNNAIQATPSGGKVMVQLSQSEAHVRIDVIDQGRGFSDEALAHLAEPFFSEKEGGMGLGLAVTSEVCRAHGGDLQACTGPDGGACVSLTLAVREFA